MTNEHDMNTEEFWEIVAEIDWASDHDYKRGERILIRRLGSMERSTAFGEIYDDLRVALDKAIQDWENDGHALEIGSDDGYGDLMAHIIGCGQEVYEAELADPKLIKKRSEAFDYKESFSYCIPWPSHFDEGALAKRLLQVSRARLAKQCARECRDAVEAVISDYLARDPDIARSPIRYEIERAVRTAVEVALEYPEVEER